MSKDEETRLERIERKLDRVVLAVYGDEEAGAMGLVFRVNNHAKRLRRIERIVAYVIGAAFIVGAAWRIFTEWPR